jgi:hypothetical protein
MYRWNDSDVELYGNPHILFFSAKKDDEKTHIHLVDPDISVSFLSNICGKDVSLWKNDCGSQVEGDDQANRMEMDWSNSQ